MMQDEAKEFKLEHYSLIRTIGEGKGSNLNQLDGPRGIAVDGDAV